MLTLAGFIISFGLCLLSLVDFRRGFLFSDYTRSTYFAFNPAQLIILAAGVAGMIVCYKLLKAVENHSQIPRSSGAVLAFGCLGLLILDLFIYRGVPAARAIASGALGADWLQAFGVTGWMRSIALSASYMLTVWHATLLGILIAGLALTALPAYFKSYFSRTGFWGTLTGAAYAIPQPFCSCCAAVMVPSYTRRGASTTFALSFVVGSPMLNITTIVLAFTMLPIQFAITRAAAGVILATVVTYGVTVLAEKWNRGSESVTAPSRQSRTPRWLSAWIERYTRVFDLDSLGGNPHSDTPTALIEAWWRASLRLGAILVPTLFLWSVVTAAIVQLLPSAFGNNLPSVVVAALTGTLLMISTWTEIPIALQLIQSGMTAPAATMLVVLPPVSLPCVMLLGGSLGKYAAVVLLTLAVMIAGIAAGIMFL